MPLGNSGLNRIPAIKQPSDCSHSLRWALRKLRMWKYRILAPDSWGECQRNDFSEPRLLNLPIHWKALNSLTWDIWFSFINNNLLTFWLPTLLLQSSYISWILPLPPLRVFWNAVSWAAVLILPQIKLNSQLSRCAFF